MNNNIIENVKIKLIFRISLNLLKYHFLFLSAPFFFPKGFGVFVF
jgi:hypothetical protein